MGKSESAKECKRHPNHNLLPGICPSCLREKLQQFHQSPVCSDSHSTFFSSSSSPSSDFFFSADSSHRRRRQHHRRNASEFVTGSMTADLFGDKMKKSGSIRISADGGAGAKGGGGKKKLGFWSRLLDLLLYHEKPKGKLQFHDPRQTQSPGHLLVFLVRLLGLSISLMIYKFLFKL
ncbi:uncharacterized protein LOC120087549 [Benincasa hispida]|uniref:uncharacterized protein LOC120087549 n=1 Tax=Benincasa hispida TaxID=102211 RepID=UPI0018FF38C0|nr:uncharacterized protein LOC120087549 [Benincasa hispida]